MGKLSLENQWVLVTGASSGLGAEMALQLARDHGAKLIISARRAERLESLKAELESNFDCECKVVSADFSNQASYAALFDQLKQWDIKAAILNAGVTFFDEDTRQPWDEFEGMLSTNVAAVVYFTRAFVTYFDEQQSDGGILAIGSMGGLVPVPYQAAYSGTKAFLTHYFLGVSQELNQKPYSVSLFAPGGIRTEMNQKSGLGDYFNDDFALQSVESCAAEAIDTLIKRKVLFVPRFTNRLQALLIKLMPRALTLPLLAGIYRKAWLATKGGSN